MRLLAVALSLLVACRCGSRSTGKANLEADARKLADTLATEVVPSCDEAQLAGHLALADAPTAARVMCQWLTGIAGYRLVGMRMVDGIPHPIMRRLIADPESGAMFVAYDELIVARPAPGKDPQIKDVFAFRQGVWLSELLAANKDAAATDFLGPSSAHAEVRAAQELVRAGDREGALKAIDALPPAVRKERGVQMLRVRAAVGIGADAYKQALAELAQTFPDDPAVALIEIDGALDVGDFDGAMRWIDTLEKAIGVEAYLEATRVIAFVRKGDLDKALATANAAVALEPTLTRALEIKLDVLIAKKLWPEVIAVMTDLETNHGARFDIAKLRAEPRLAELVATAEFTEWVAARGPQ